MTSHRLSRSPKTLLRGLDPRHSLVAGIIWLVIALAASFAIAASVWVGGVAREIVLQQHVRRLALETDQLGSDLGQAVTARLQALRATDGGTPSPAIFERLATTYPHLGWTALVNAAGVVLAGDGSIGPGTNVAERPWFSAGLKGPWIGVIEENRATARAPVLGDLATPLKDAEGHVIGVVAAHLTWHWAGSDVHRLSATLNPSGFAQTLVLNRADTVLVGADELRNRPWAGVILAMAPGTDLEMPGTPRFERLPDGQTVLVARAAVSVDGEPSAVGWQVQLSEPKQQVYQRANALAGRILWISVCLGTATAFIGALGARHLTNRLKRLTRSAGAVGRNEIARIEVPSGRDEVAQLAAAFAKILDDLRQERSDLLTLSSELERRVAVRTREVERLAEEARYAAIVRERLKIARDLHDTLAHSMMAMLSEVRLLRNLQLHDPTALPEELVRAEKVAHEGLTEARIAIAQMRVNAVRDTGLGAALAKAFDRFVNHTGLIGEFTTHPAAARFGDERAETLFRMAEEALRNIERHAMATRVDVALAMHGETHLSLRIADDGNGFDPSTSRPGHFGLVGLREQAHLIDADLRIDSAPNHGTTLTIQLRIVPEIL
ncbi:MAG TPA: histidine kinase [Steroidobacteraceae bacterium]|jgi:signal transduction histidine kinase